MDDDICAMEELAAEEWRKGYRVEVPLVYDVKSAEVREKEEVKLGSPEVSPEPQRTRLLPRATDEEIYLKEFHKDIMKRVRERYKSEQQPHSSSPTFPELPPSKPSGEIEIVGSLRPYGVRFIHYPENYADCSCIIEPQLMNYFEQRFRKPPLDRFDEDYFGDVNFQGFLRGPSDQFALLHHSRTFTAVGSCSKTWFFVTFSSELTERAFKDRSEFIAQLKCRLEEAHSAAWSKSFLMCPKPYPQSFVIPMRERDENILLQNTYQDSLILTSSPELQREADLIDDIENTIWLDYSNSSASHPCNTMFGNTFIDEFPKDELYKCLDSSPASSLEGELPLDSTWFDTSFESSDGDSKTQNEKAEVSGTEGELFWIGDSVEEEVFSCVQRIISEVESKRSFPKHENLETSGESSTSPKSYFDFFSELTATADLDSLGFSSATKPRASSMDQFDPLIETSDHQNTPESQSGTRFPQLYFFDTDEPERGSDLAEVSNQRPLLETEGHRSTSTNAEEVNESTIDQIGWPNSRRLELATPSLPEMSNSQGSTCVGIGTPSSLRPQSDPLDRPTIELTSSGASFRKPTPKRCTSLPATRMGPSREQSLFLADTIASLRPFGVRFIADLENYGKCSCRPCSAISQLWNRSERLSAVADFDMDQFGDMLLANFIMAREGSAALLLHYAGTFDLIAVEENRWMYVHNDFGEIQKQIFSDEDALFSLVEKRISRTFNSRTLLEKSTCPLPEGMTQNDPTSTMMERTLRVKENVKANMARKLSNLEHQKDVLGKKFASFMTRIGH